MISRVRSWTAAAVSGLVLAGVFPGLAACGHPCGGQCGPPYQLLVIFRPGISMQAASAAMYRCAGNPLVIRVGRVYRYRGNVEPPVQPGSLVATIYTRAMFAGAQEDHLVHCLRQSRLVTVASYPD